MSEKRISVLQFFSLARRRKVGDDAIRCKSTEKQNRRRRASRRCRRPWKSPRCMAVPFRGFKTA